MPVPILEVTAGGLADGKLFRGHHIFAINGQSAKGMSKRDAHKAIKECYVVKFTVSAVARSGPPPPLPGKLGAAGSGTFENAEC